MTTTSGLDSIAEVQMAQASLPQWVVPVVATLAATVLMVIGVLVVAVIFVRRPHATATASSEPYVLRSLGRRAENDFDATEDKKDDDDDDDDDDNTREPGDVNASSSSCMPVPAQRRL